MLIGGLAACGSSGSGTTPQATAVSPLPSAVSILQSDGYTADSSLTSSLQSDLGSTPGVPSFAAGKSGKGIQLVIVGTSPALASAAETGEKSVLGSCGITLSATGDCHRPSERVVGSGSRQQPSRLTNERKRSDDPGNEREESRTRPGHIRNTFSSNFSKMLQQIYPRRAVVIWAELPRCPGSRLDVVLGGLSVRHSAARGPRSRFAIGHDRTAGHGWHLGLSRPGPRDPCPGRRHRAQLGRRYPGMGRRRGYQAQRRRLAAEPPRGRDGTP